jgi:hypothetical protein
VSRHVSAEDLASLDLDALKPRKAARIRAHVAVCIQCTQLSSDVGAVSVTLASASVSYQAMPANLSDRLDAALASESAQRLADAPATEAGRRDLPARSDLARPERRGWQLPGMSVLTTRLVAAAGALVIIGVGGYTIATNAGPSNSGTSASSSGAAAQPRAATPQLSVGAALHYGSPGARKTIPIISSAMNFLPGKLRVQVVAAVQAARLRGAVGFQGVTGAPAATAGAGTNSANKAAGALTSSGLAGCIDHLVGGQTVLLVETARYAGKPATIIVTASSATRSAEVWIVGPACSPAHPDVLGHLRLSRT